MDDLYKGRKPKAEPPEQDRTPALAFIALVLAFLAPPIGAIIGFSAYHNITASQKKEGKNIALAALIIGGVGSILVLPIAVSAIFSATLFVLPTQEIVPERCDFGGDISCISASAAVDGSLSFEIRNNRQSEITLSQVIVTKNAQTICSTQPNMQIPVADSRSVRVGSCGFNTDRDDRVAVSVELHYSDDLQIERVQPGLIRAVVR